MENRVLKALDIACKSAGVDGEHHKQWVIDQMIRALTNCPMIQRKALNAQGKQYDYLAQGESDEYMEWVANFEDGDDGPKTWDIGIAP